MPTTRFAPSPTGLLHLGHAHAALFAHARAEGGRFLLRLEDIDAARCRPEYAQAILDDLAWLGLRWDDPRVQSEHMREYAAALDALRRGGLVYPCFCTRADVARAGGAPHGTDDLPTYPGTCRSIAPSDRDARLAAGAPHAWRLDMNYALRVAPSHLWFVDGDAVVRADPAPFGDVVLARKDVPASYHLCATYDDALQGVTLVTRGEDLRPATHLHRLLQALMGLPTPAYAHHRLLTDDTGRRLAKRDHAATLRALRDSGTPPQVARRMAGFA